MSSHGIVHIEIPTGDTQASKDFFEDVFGWQTSQTEGDMVYHMWDAGDGPAGGFVELSDEVKPGDVIIYIGTDDIPATLEKIEAHGGEVLQPEMKIPGFGSLAVFQDPTGNRLALWKGLSSGG